ncbi:hypothetical protein A5641_00010 [Mycobacterium sp. 1554424.7]|nr:hypothetical protein A5641_00010 [Mycobacterium sp. 1554424.7]
MSTGPAVAKAVWTATDFEQMSWHDCAVHAVAVEPAPPNPGRLLVDLDYIVEWVCPEPPANAFSFAICPATLVFDEAWDLVGDINLRGFSFELSLETLGRSDPDEHGACEWTLAGHEFTLALRAPGFSQYLRRAPIRSPQQRLSVSERGGLSFDRLGYFG